MTLALNIGQGMPVQTMGTGNYRVFGQWSDFVHEHFPWLKTVNRSHSEFQADVERRQLGANSFTCMATSANEVVRTPEMASRAEAGFVKVFWQLAGSASVEQDGRSSIIEAGQVTLVDTARPYRIALCDGAKFSVLALPYEVCPGWERISQRLCGAPYQDAQTARAAYGALASLLNGGLPEDSRGFDNVLTAVQWMLAASFHQVAGVTTPASRKESRIKKAEDHILRHIGDPNLDAAEVAAALCMSRRSLYLLFKEYGLTPARLIHDLRLDRCRAALCVPTSRRLSITEIALDHGFSDCASFSRLFRAHYGMTPSECRTRALGSLNS